MTKLEQGFVLRLATREDIPALRELIASSVRVLQRGDYSPAQLEAALGTVYGVDTQLIVDGSYYVVETTTDAKGKIIERRNSRDAAGEWVVAHRGADVERRALDLGDLLPKG